MPLVEQDGFDAANLSRLPSLESLASAPVTVDPHHPEYAAPALSNQWGGVMAGRDLMSYVGFSCPGLYHHGAQGELFLSGDGGPLEASGAALGEITYLWEAGRISRSGTYGGLRLQCETVLSTAAQVVLSRLSVENPGGREATLDLFLRYRADVRSKPDPNWPPSEEPTAAIGPDLLGTGLQVLECDGEAAAAVGAGVAPAGLASFAAEDPRWTAALTAGRLDGSLRDGDTYGVLHYRLTVPAAGSATLEVAHALAATPGQARAQQRLHMRDFQGRVEEAAAEWEREWRAAFTPGSGRFSGHLPVLESANPKLERLYYTSVLTLLYCKRTERFGSQAWVYATGFPSSPYTFAITWAFPWDAMMVSGILSLLDPAAMRAMLEAWLEADLHQGCAVDFLTGKPVGFWYAVNDYALIHMMHQYLRYTGDRPFLKQEVAGRSVLEHLVTAANYYQRIAGDDGLADYGAAENLLECVSTYTGKVASFNAANAWNLRTVASLLEQDGDRERAREMRERARAVAERVQELYLPGEGYWQCKQPDGRMVPVRHCLDFFTVAQCMSEDLRPGQLEEMTAFFLRELKTSTWMHALSPLDPDSASSSRTDHQDEGAYTTWPAYCLEVLLQAGRQEEALDWIGDEGREGIADVTRQGPFGQAYCHGDEGSFRFAGAGAKAPMEQPHIEKPVLLSGGKYAQVVIEALCGLDPEAATATGRPLPYRVELSNLGLRGRHYRLAAGGSEGA